MKRNNSHILRAKRQNCKRKKKIFILRRSITSRTPLKQRWAADVTAEPLEDWLAEHQQASWPQMLPDWSLVLPEWLSGSPLISYNTDEHPGPRKRKKKKKKNTLEKTSPHINFLTLNAVIDANGKTNLGSDFVLRTANINLPGDGEEES